MGRSVGTGMCLMKITSQQNYQSRCECKFLPRTLRTSCVNRNASSTGNRLSRAVSMGSENQDLMGMALSG